MARYQHVVPQGDGNHTVLPRPECGFVYTHASGYEEICILEPNHYVQTGMNHGAFNGWRRKSGHRLRCATCGKSIKAVPANEGPESLKALLYLGPVRRQRASR